MENQTVRLVDVAKKAGVSAMTVSLALRNHPRISEPVRLRIQAMAAKMGYQPDPVAKALREKSSMQSGTPRFLGTVGLIMSEAYAAELRMNPHCKEDHRLLESTCRSMGYQLNRFTVGQTRREQKSLDRILKARGIKGFFFYSDNKEIHEWELDWSAYAVVAYSSSVNEHFVHDVITSSFQDAYDTMVELRRLGYQRPGYFIPREGHGYWSAGFSVGLKNLWDETASLPVVDWTISDGQEQIKKVFCEWVEEHGPDVVVSNDMTRVRYLQEMGLRVPEDIGYVDLDVRSGLIDISGVIQQREFAHRVMVDLLHGMLMRHEYGPPVVPMCIQIPSFWNLGTTVRQQD